MELHLSVKLDPKSVYCARPEGAVDGKVTLFLSKHQNTGLDVSTLSLVVAFFDENGAELDRQIIFEGSCPISDLGKIVKMLTTYDVELHGE